MEGRVGVRAVGGEGWGATEAEAMEGVAMEAAKEERVAEEDRVAEEERVAEARVKVARVMEAAARVVVAGTDSR